MPGTIEKQIIPLTMALPGGVTLPGDLVIPRHPRGVVLFAHGSGSSRSSPRNQRVAEHLQDAGFATLLFDLLTESEEAIDARNGIYRFNISMLAERLRDATDWIVAQPATRGLHIGYFGASTGAAAALVAAAAKPDVVHAVVSRGGRPDLAGPLLGRVKAPTLLIVGGEDTVVIALNEAALREIGTGAKRLEIVPGATHLFEERGALEQVARLAREWFDRHLAGEREASPSPAAGVTTVDDSTWEIC